ncbi:UNKNOWN [Stylonychia lemnae]|uniref:Uncharacterized protein n=1 Tax=Stylonychia lemnae TaxID=5949 RepID=A0A077ZTV2_STYLE|nr:UNKNOWN [Stylonychia lemnae]|eukprot:CDW72999.1 UNKNOWN [Stylonychia lemnae]
MAEEYQPRDIKAEAHFNKIMTSSVTTPFYLRYNLSQENPDLPNFNFGKHFNPRLADESEYFQRLNKLMSCVQKNVDKELTPAQQDKVCEKEFKQLRLAAFSRDTLYHNVNKRLFQNELSVIRNESPY